MPSLVRKPVLVKKGGKSFLQHRYVKPAALTAAGLGAGALLLPKGTEAARASIGNALLLYAGKRAKEEMGYTIVDPVKRGLMHFFDPGRRATYRDQQDKLARSLALAQNYQNQEKLKMVSALAKEKLREKAYNPSTHTALLSLVGLHS